MCNEIKKKTCMYVLKFTKIYNTKIWKNIHNSRNKHNDCIWKTTLVALATYNNNIHKIVRKHKQKLCPPTVSFLLAAAARVGAGVHLPVSDSIADTNCIFPSSAYPAAPASHLLHDLFFLSLIFISQFFSVSTFSCINVCTKIFSWGYFDMRLVVLTRCMLWNMFTYSPASFPFL